MEADLTLKKAKRMIRQCEAVHEHQEILNSSSSSQTLSKCVNTGCRKRSCKCTSQNSYRKPEANRSKSDEKCTHNRSGHPRHQCSARDATYHSCNRRGHFKSQWF